MSEARLLREVEIALGSLPGVLLRRGSVMVRDAVDGRTRYLPGLGPGTPDLVLCVDGRWVGIELKADNDKGRGRPEPTQLDFQRHVRIAGGRYEFCWSVAEALRVIENARNP